MTKNDDNLPLERRVALGLCEDGRGSHEFWIGKTIKQRRAIYSDRKVSDDHDQRWVAYYEFIEAVLRGEYD